MGFFFRIFLSQRFGETQMGIYQLIFPIYALCFSLSSAGIETALCRLVASRTSKGKHKESQLLLYSALFISGLLSLFLMIGVRKYATQISLLLLDDSRTVVLLRTVVLSLPFASIHSCICGYYLGKKQIKIPAVSQFVEQLVRISTVCLLYYFMTLRGFPISVNIAVIGIVCGEIVSSLYCLRYYFSKKHTSFQVWLFSKHQWLNNELWKLAMPLTGTRVLSNLLQSVENISIPLFLQKFGYHTQTALSIYGVLTGMALPCILFPSAITNALSSMLLPTVAEIESENNIYRLKHLIRRVIFFGFGLGSFCGLFFLFGGSLIGQILFHNKLTGDFLCTLAWLCPFLYMNSTLISILNGLGKANLTFLINILGISIRIAGVWWGIARFGINGYLWGFLLSQLVVSLLCLSVLNQEISRRELD
jgi:stage V sporulation protein B